MDYKKEQLRITISLSMMAILIASINVVYQMDIKDIQILYTLKNVLLAYSIVPALFYFFAFIIGTSSLLKSDEIGKIDDNIYTTEKMRMFNYASGIKSMITGIHITGTIYLVSLLDKIIAIPCIDNSLIFSVIFFLLIGVVCFIGLDYLLSTLF